VKLLILGHHSLANRGCEALLRSTVAMVRKQYPDAEFRVPSVAADIDRTQWPQASELGVTFIEARHSTVGLRAWARACRMMPSLLAWPWPSVAPPFSWREHLRGCDAALAIGGDNFTLDYGLESLAFHVGLVHGVRQYGCPTVLWGASLGPFEVQTPLGRAMALHLGTLKAITLRESLSLEGWQTMGAGLTPDQQPKVSARLVADPAFTLQAEPVDLAPHWPEGTAPLLGLNLSPLTVPGSRDAWLDEVAGLLRHWCESNRVRVLLVPHVSARNVRGTSVHRLPATSDDDVLLDQLQFRLRGVKGVSRVPSWNAPALKFAIASCDLFIGARTHSVIAALSSRIPSVALAYSLKARGIHRDLLGHEAGVLPLAHLSAQALDGELTALMSRAPSERQTLNERIPLWQRRAMESLHALGGSAA
jgi:colanic acid/amylovoran biosynthesis protein